MSDQFDFDTLAVRAGIHRSEFNEHSEALYLTSSFVFRSAAQAAARFANEEPGNVYSRFTNPTVTAFQERLAALEGGEACVATASGMSAILACAMGLLKSGDHIVSSSSIFGATVQLFTTVLGKFGVETTFVAGGDPAAWARAVRPDDAAALPRDAIQSADRDRRHRRARGRRAAREARAGGGQLLLHAGAAAAARARRGPGDPFGDQVSRRAGQGARRRGARSPRSRHGRGVPVPAHRGSEPVAVQCLGAAEGPGDPADPHGRAVAARRSSSRRWLEAHPQRRARLLSRAAFPPAARAGDAPADARAARSSPSTSRAGARRRGA